MNLAAKPFENIKEDDSSTENKELLLTQEYRSWIKFKREFLKEINEMVKLGKISFFICRNCQVRKKIDEINIYDLFFGFSFDKINVEKETIEKFNVEFCNECNKMSDTTNSYIKVLENKFSCETCKERIINDTERLSIDQKNFCSRECLRRYLNKKL